MVTIVTGREGIISQYININRHESNKN
jgi:hypothetical protein